MLCTFEIDGFLLQVIRVRNHVIGTREPVVRTPSGWVFILSKSNITIRFQYNIRSVDVLKLIFARVMNALKISAESSI